MRLWSLHPKHLDAKGLVALWREALLAKHVLEGRTNGYRNHPQLSRFKELEHPVDAINQYLSVVYEEAVSRGYNFNKGKVEWKHKKCSIRVTQGQINYESMHLLNKLKSRDIGTYKEIKSLTSLDAHPLFKIVKGDVEDWEVVTEKRS